LGRLDALSSRLAEALGEAGTDTAAGEVGVQRAFVERMEDDLDTPGATAVLFDAIRQANVAFDARETGRATELARAVIECFGAVGLQARQAGEIPDSVLELGRRRDQARLGRDFATADSLRAEILALGYLIEDTAAGTRIRR